VDAAKQHPRQVIRFQAQQIFPMKTVGLDNSSVWAISLAGEWPSCLPTWVFWASGAIALCTGAAGK
jgi:hypothetical protein